MNKRSHHGHHQEVVIDVDPPRDEAKLHSHTHRWEDVIHPKVSLVVVVTTVSFLGVLFLFWSIPHHDEVVSLADVLWRALLSLLTLALTWIGPVLLVAAALGLVIKWNIKPLLECGHLFQQVLGQRHKNTVAAAMEQYAITVHEGKPQFHQVSQERTTYNLKGDIPGQLPSPEDGTEALPTFVRYEEVRPYIPAGHALVGVTGHGIETKEDYIRALLWIVGNSGVGKTNSTVIRVDDDARRGHEFLGVDPHAFKPDSLTNALRGYASRFRLPIAQRLEDIEAVLDAFSEEFYGRRDEGWPTATPITLTVDEVGSLTMDIDKKDVLAVRVAAKLKEIARICGQESRGFNMYGIYISQNAAGLAWLRRYALMVLAHQVLTMSERLLVCNQDRAIANSMSTWPKGRTLVYGIAFQEGSMLVQQPIVTPSGLKPERAENKPEAYFYSASNQTAVMPELPTQAFRQEESTRNGRNAFRNADETPLEADAEMKVTPLFRVSEEESSARSKKEIVSDETKRAIVRMARDMPLRKVAAYVGLGGEKYGIFKQVCEEMGIKKTEEASH